MQAHFSYQSREFARFASKMRLEALYVNLGGMDGEYDPREVNAFISLRPLSMLHTTNNSPFQLPTPKKLVPATKAPLHSEFHFGIHRQSKENNFQSQFTILGELLHWARESGTCLMNQRTF